MFHKKSLKLAGLYLTIIMFISLFFSAAIYQLSTSELDHGLRHPDAGPAGVAPEYGLSRSTREALREERNAQYEESTDHVLNRLIVTNLMILVAAGFLSYYLAERTLRPIEEANEALERFTSDASHELRTPIAAMQSEIEVALMDPKLSSKDAKNILKSNLEELAKLTALSVGLLKLAHRENGQMLQESVSVKSVINSSVSRVEPLAKKKKIDFNTSAIPQTAIRGDEVALTEAVFVILDNAVKYSPDKKAVNIDVSHKKKRVTISVTDQGPGIKPDELTHIFERFYRADSARSKSTVEGYGIGLALAKHIVESHDGTIAVSSKPGKGSTFTLRLPA